MDAHPPVDRRLVHLHQPRRLAFCDNCDFSLTEAVTQMRQGPPCLITSRHRPAGGLTLVELLCVLALLAILATLATPGFGSQISRLRIHQSASELKGALLLARSEAVRRGEDIKIRKHNVLDHGACSSIAASDWSCGWIVFLDRNNNGTFEERAPITHDNDELLQVFAPGHGTVVHFSSHASVLTVNRWGALNGIGASFTISSHVIDSAQGVIICISSGGRIRTIDGGVCT